MTLSPAPAGYSPLTAETLPARLGFVAAVRERLGEPGCWQVREVGDGNLNLVFIVESPRGAVAVKQSLPYVRAVGTSWPMGIERTFYDYHALVRLGRRAPGQVPEVLYFDSEQSLIVMEYLSPHIVLRRALIEGRALPQLGRDLGLFTARTLFRGSDLSMVAAERKADVALFAGNVELCKITEDLVFTDPYIEIDRNRHTTPQLDGIVAALRADRDLKVEAQHLLRAFTARAETLLHGDLHTGSIMVTGDDTRVIDAEFAVYGPMGFDIGMLLANFWMAALAQPGHETQPGARAAYTAGILDTAEEIWAVFRAEFARLWRSERSGILYPTAMFEARGDRLGSEQALAHVLHEIFCDMLGFAGIEMHRRILGFAHNADFESIADADRRAALETQALKLGRHLAVNRQRIASLAELRAVAEALASGALA